MTDKKVQVISCPSKCAFCEKEFGQPTFVKNNDTLEYSVFCPHCGLEIMEAITWEEYYDDEELKKEGDIECLMKKKLKLL